MSGTGAVPSTDHGWLAKVLGGDRLACGLLDLARCLPADEWDAFAGRCGSILAGAPTADPVLRVTYCAVRLA